MIEQNFTPEELQTEEWRAVVGHEGFYSVSDLGRVRRDLPEYGTYQGRILKPGLSRYLRVVLCKNGKLRRAMVHTLVAAAFIGERPLGLVIDHIDGIKTNNRPSNLEYVTQEENEARAKRMGLKIRLPGESNPMSKLKESDIVEVRALCGTMTQRAIAGRYGVSEATISLIAHGKLWGTVKQ